MHVQLKCTTRALSENFHLQPLELPKTLSQQARKQYSAICKAYDGLAEVFKDGILNDESDQRLIAEATAGEAWWAPVSHLVSHMSSI